MATSRIPRAPGQRELATERGMRTLAASTVAKNLFFASPVAAPGAMQLRGIDATDITGITFTVAQGGTGDTSFVAYAVIVGGTTTTGALQTVAAGTTGQALLYQGSAAKPAYGTLGVAAGGTGDTAFTAYAVTCGGTTTTGALQSVAAGTTGQALLYQGSSALPAYGTLAVGGGGSGATSFTAYCVLCAGTTTTGALQAIAAVGSSGQLLASNGASALPTFGDLPAGQVSRFLQSGTVSITGNGTVTTTFPTGITSATCSIKTATLTDPALVSCTFSGNTLTIYAWTIALIASASAGTINWIATGN